MPNPIICERVIEGKRYHQYWCPGCDNVHQITIRPDRNNLGAGWEFSGTIEKPTYAPSQLTSWGGPKGQPNRVCHTFIREGQIQFLDDCTHALKGQTVPLPPVPDWLAAEADET